VSGPASGVFVDGEWGGQGTCVDVINPSTEEIVSSVRTASLEDVRRGIGAARSAYDRMDWASAPRAQRVRTVLQLIDALVERQERIRQIVVAEAGCPVASPVMAVQVDLPLKHARDYAQ